MRVYGHTVESVGAWRLHRLAVAPPHRDEDHAGDRLRTWRLPDGRELLAHHYPTEGGWLLHAVIRYGQGIGAGTHTLAADEVADLVDAAAALAGQPAQGDLWG